MQQRPLLVLLLLFLLLVPDSYSGPRVARAQTRRNKIIDENERPGSTRWNSPELKRAKAERETEEHGSRSSYSDRGGVSAAAWTDTQAIKGYASLTSINHGDSIIFHVSTTQPSYTIEIFRMGWYAGTGARLITTISNMPGSNYGVPTPDPTKTSLADWNKVTLYRNGTLIWGIEPGSTLAPTFQP